MILIYYWRTDEVPDAGRVDVPDDGGRYDREAEDKDNRAESFSLFSGSLFSDLGSARLARIEPHVLILCCTFWRGVFWPLMSDS